MILTIQIFLCALACCGIGIAIGYRWGYDNSYNQWHKHFQRIKKMVEVL